MQLLYTCTPVNLYTCTPVHMYTPAATKNAHTDRTIRKVFSVEMTRSYSCNGSVYLVFYDNIFILFLSKQGAQTGQKNLLRKCWIV